MSALHQRYAQALYQAAAEAQALPAVGKAVAALRAALAEASVSRALASPALSAAQRQQLAQSLAASVQAPQPLAGLLSVVAVHGRLAQLGGILQAFTALMDKADGLLSARVESAQPLTDAQRSALTGSLKAKTGARNVTLQESVNPALVGGFRAFYAGQVWDATVAGRFNQLASALRHGQPAA